MAFQRKKPAAIGVKAPFPGFIEPALATSIDKVPTGERWIHEIKFDGYRVQVHLANEAVKVFTRRGNDWTNRFKKIADDAWHISAGSAIIDGEIVVPAADGTTDFSVLQNELKGKSTKIVLVAFDLLYLNGYDLRKLPLVERKAHLKKLIAGDRHPVQRELRDRRPRDVRARLQGRAGGRRLKGARQPLRSGRGNDWVKKTCAQRETLTIAGFALDGNNWDGIYLGRRKGNDLVYAGKVDHGFDKTSAAELAQAPDAADPQDPALRQADRAQGHLGRAGAAGRDRVPGEVRRGQGAAPVLQGAAGGFMIAPCCAWWWRCRASS